MSANVSKVTLDEPNNLLARINSEDDAFIAPLREYLENYGCTVIVNSSKDQLALYRFICGSGVYVKSFISDMHQFATKTLLIVQDNTRIYAKEDIPQNLQIAYIDSLYLSDSHIQKLCNFLFTSKEKFLDLRLQKLPFLSEKIEIQEKKYDENFLSRTRQTAKPEKVMFHQSQMNNSNVQENYRPTNNVPNDRQRINELIASIFQNTTSEKKTKQKIRDKKNPTWGVIIFTISTIILYGILYLSFIFVSLVSFIGSAKLMKANNTSSSGLLMRVGSFSIETSKKMFPIIAVTGNSLGFETTTREQERLLFSLGKIQEALIDFEKITDKAKLFGETVLTSSLNSSTQLSPLTQAKSLEIDLIRVASTLGLAQAEIEELQQRSPRLFGNSFVRKHTKEGSEVLTALRNNINVVSQLLTLYPQVAGFRKNMSYLILFQNSMELRPTGGFIGSIGSMNLAEGIMNDFTIVDVYDLDGQLKGHVDPPIPIRDLLGQEHWYLRDSNWDPDFAISGQKAQWFYEKESGKSVDGVIGVSLPFIVNLLKATGPILLIDYNDTITADNFYGKALFYTRSDFFPGSTQKKDFLGSLSRALIDRLTSAKGVDPYKVFLAIVHALESRDVQFYFVSADIERLVEQYGWTGAIPSGSLCEGINASCLSDTVSVIEANLGVNKTNYFIRGNTLLRMTLDDAGQVLQTISHTLTNTSTGESIIGGGSYKSYTRFYLPSNSTLSAVLIDGAPLSSQNGKNTKKNIPYGEFIDNTPKGNIYGIGHEVSIGQEQRLTLSYAHRDPLVFIDGKAEVRLLVQKQAGVMSQGLNLKLQFPTSFNANGFILDGNSTKRLVASDGQLEYNTTLLRDVYITIYFTK